LPQLEILDTRPEYAGLHLITANLADPTSQTADRSDAVEVTASSLSVYASVIIADDLSVVEVSNAAAYKRSMSSCSPIAQTEALRC